MPSNAVVGGEGGEDVVVVDGDGKRMASTSWINVKREARKRARNERQTVASHRESQATVRLAKSLSPANTVDPI